MKMLMKSVAIPVMFLISSGLLAEEFDISNGTPYQFDSTAGSYSAVASIDGLNQLYVYEKTNAAYLNVIWGVILTADPITGAITHGPAFEIESAQGYIPALCKVDSTHYLCAYSGPSGEGRILVLTLDMSTKTITKSTALNFGDSVAINLSITPIDTTNFLCTYSQTNDPSGLIHGWAAVFTVNPSAWTVGLTHSHHFSELKGSGNYIDSCSIDGFHHLLVYVVEDEPKPGMYTYNERARILTIDPSSYSISEEKAFDYADRFGNYKDLIKIDGAHVLMAYPDYDNVNGVLAQIIEIDPVTWRVSPGTPERIDSGSYGDTPTLAQIDNTHFLCTYRNWGSNGAGWAVALSTDTSTDTVTKGFQNKIKIPSALTGFVDVRISKIDSQHYLCAYIGIVSFNAPYEGWAEVLKVNSTLMVDNGTVPEAGGSVNFDLDAGLANTGRQYVILGGVTGSYPGTPLPGGQVVLPVNFDLFMVNGVIPNLNSTIFSNFLGNLAAEGHGAAQFNLPPVPGFAGLVMTYAYALDSPWDFVSNPIEIEIIP